MNTPTFVRAALIVAAAAVLSSCAHAAPKGPPIPLAKVDLSRMYGGWYIVATIPNRFEKGLVAPYDVYSRRPDGDIREDFYVQKGGFDAPRKHFVVRDSVRPGTGNADWRVHIFGVLSLPFQVLHVDDDYRFVLFGEQDRSLGWIYSRTPTIDEADYSRLLGEFQAVGYDPARFRRIIHTPDQIGQPGFWSDDVHAR